MTGVNTERFRDQHARPYGQLAGRLRGPLVGWAVCSAAGTRRGTRRGWDGTLVCCLLQSRKLKPGEDRRKPNVGPPDLCNPAGSEA
jgi:hypothetical protein